MRFYRFMSRAEFIDLMNGKNMINEIDFGKKGANTNSVGFCFLREKTEAFRTDESDNFAYYTNPYELLRVMGGIVDEGILVGFEETSLSNLFEGWGGYNEGTKITEYSTPNYNYNTLIPVSYSLFTEEDCDINALNKHMKNIEREIPLDYPDKRLVCIYNKLDIDWINENEHLFDTDCYRYLATYQQLTEEFILNHINNFDEDGLIELIKHQNISNEIIKLLSDTNYDSVKIALIENCKIDENILLDNLNLIENAMEGRNYLLSCYLKNNIASDTLLDYLKRKAANESSYDFSLETDSLIAQIKTVDNLNNIVNIYLNEEINNSQIHEIYREILNKKILTPEEIRNSKTFDKTFLLEPPFAETLDITKNIELYDSPYFEPSLKYLPLNLETLKQFSFENDYQIENLLVNKNINVEDLFSFLTEKYSNSEMPHYFAQSLIERKDINDKSLLNNIKNYSIELQSLLVGVHNLDKETYLKESPLIIDFFKPNMTKEEIIETFTAEEFFVKENIKKYNNYFYRRDFIEFTKSYEITPKVYENIMTIFEENIKQKLFVEANLSKEMYDLYGKEILEAHIKANNENSSTKISIDKLTKIIENNNINDIWETIKNSRFSQKNDMIYFVQNYIIENNISMEKDLFLDILNGGEKGFPSISFDNILAEKSEKILERFDLNYAINLNDDKLNELYFKYMNIPQDFIKDNYEKLSKYQIECLCDNKNFTEQDMDILLKSTTDKEHLINIIVSTPKENKQLIDKLCEMKLDYYNISDIFVNQSISETQSMKLIDNLIEMKSNNELSQGRLNSLIIKCVKYQELSPDFIEKIIEKNPDSMYSIINQEKLPFNVFKNNIDKFFNPEFYSNNEERTMSFFNTALRNYATTEDKNSLKEIANIYFDNLEELTIRKFLEHKIFSEDVVVNNFEEIFSNYKESYSYKIPETKIINILNNDLENNQSQVIKFAILDNINNYSQNFMENTFKKQTTDFYKSYIDTFHKEMEECSKNHTTLSPEIEERLRKMLSFPNFYQAFKAKMYFKTLSIDFFEKNKDTFDKLGKTEEFLESMLRYDYDRTYSLEFKDKYKEYISLQNLDSLISSKIPENIENYEQKTIEREKVIDQISTEISEKIKEKIEQDYTKHEIYSWVQEIGSKQELKTHEVKNNITSNNITNNNLEL